MAMLIIECPNCGHTDALRGWVEPEDLKDTPWAELDEKGIIELEKRQKGLLDKYDPWSRFDTNPVCPKCGSKDVISY